MPAIDNPMDPDVIAIREASSREIKGYSRVSELLNEIGGTQYAYEYHVSPSGAGYTTIPDAIAAINADGGWSSDVRPVVIIHPGTYTMTSAITVPRWCTVKGIDKNSVRLKNNTTNMFTMSNNTWLQDFLIEGENNSTLWNIEANDSSDVHVRRVDQLDNGGLNQHGFFVAEGSSFRTIFIEDCIVNSYRTSGRSIIRFWNTGAAARAVDAVVNNVFLDAFQLSNFMTGVQNIGCTDLRIRNSTIRGQGQFMTGVRTELNGVTGTPETEVRHCFLGGGPGDQGYGGGATALFCEAGTRELVYNSFAPSVASAGTRVTFNSTTTTGNP